MVALRRAQELFLFTAEFHVTNINPLRGVPRTGLAEIPSGGRPYKALVYMYLAGGADTYAPLVRTRAPPSQSEHFPRMAGTTC